MAQTPEGKVKDGIKKWLKSRGAYFAMPMGTGYGRSGTPDFLCCINGVFVAIEAKAPGKRNNTTDAQDAQIVEIHKAGGIAVVIDDPAMLNELEKRLG